MGEAVADLRHQENALRCPIEVPPGGVTITLSRRLDTTTVDKVISTADDATLIASAKVSFTAFDSDADTILGSWYTVGLRDSVFVDSVEYDEKEELWELYKVLS